MVRVVIEMLSALQQSGPDGAFAQVFGGLDDRRHACRLTGFLPLHVAVANGLADMYSLLLDLAAQCEPHQASPLRSLSTHRSPVHVGTASVGRRRTGCAGRRSLCVE